MRRHRIENREGKTKQPLCVHRKDDALFAFAGLWDEWTSPDGSPLRSCTIVTVAPNDLMAAIHNRMPAILRPEDEGTWLNGSVTSVNELLALLAPYPDDEIEAYPVSTAVNSVANDGSACIEAIDAEPDLTLTPLLTVQSLQGSLWIAEPNRIRIRE